MLTAHKVAEFAKKEIVALTGLPVDTISAIARKEDNWVVTLDLLELRMVPDPGRAGNLRSRNERHRCRSNAELSTHWPLPPRSIRAGICLAKRLGLPT